MVRQQQTEAPKPLSAQSPTSTTPRWIAFSAILARLPRHSVPLPRRTIPLFLNRPREPIKATLVLPAPTPLSPVFAELEFYRVTRCHLYPQPPIASVGHDLLLAGLVLLSGRAFEELPDSRPLRALHAQAACQSGTRATKGPCV